MIYRHEERAALLFGWVTITCIVEDDKMHSIEVTDEDSGQKITMEQEMFFTLLGTDAMSFCESAMKLAQNVRLGVQE